MGEHRHRTWRPARLLCLSALVAVTSPLPLAVAPARADVLTLKSGATYVGIVTERTRSTVSFQSGGIVWTFPARHIARVALEAAGRQREQEAVLRAALTAARPGGTSGTYSSAIPAPAAPAAGRETADESQVIVYGTSWCGFCHRVRSWLSARHIPFVDKDVEHDPDAREEVARKCLAAGSYFDGGVPVLDVYGSIIRGFDLPRIEQALQHHASD